MTTKGRPRKQAGEVRDELVEIRLSPLEKRTFKVASDLAGLPLSTWIRERIRRAAIRELEDAGRLIPLLHHAE